MKEQFMILLHHAKIQKRFFDAFYNNWKVTETPGMVLSYYVKINSARHQHDTEKNSKQRGN